jgi:hypothetical protein
VSNAGRPPLLPRPEWASEILNELSKHAKKTDDRGQRIEDKVDDINLQTLLHTKEIRDIKAVQETHSRQIGELKKSDSENRVAIAKVAQVQQAQTQVTPHVAVLTPHAPHAPETSPTYRDFALERSRSIEMVASVRRDSHGVEMDDFSSEFALGRSEITRNFLIREANKAAKKAAADALKERDAEKNKKIVDSFRNREADLKWKVIGAVVMVLVGLAGAAMFSQWHPNHDTPVPTRAP